MATIVASAAGGAWTVGTTWVGGVAPTAADSAQIPVTAGNITIDSGAVCQGFDFTGYTGTATHTAGVTLTVGNSTAALSNIAAKFSATMTYTLGNSGTSAISFISTSATQQTIDPAGKTTGDMTFNAASAGSWQFTGAHTTTGTFTLTKGTLDINGQTCSWGLLVSDNTNVRSLTLGAANITITFPNALVWNTNTTSNLTLSAAASTITLNNSNQQMLTGGLAYGSVIFTGLGAATLGGSSTLANLTRTGTALKTDSFTISGNYTVTGTLTLTGNSAINRLIIQSNTIGTARTITAAAVSLTNTDFMDITGAGAASPFTGTSLGDCGGNSGITFTTSATQTWSGTSGGNWSANAWTSRVPLPQDDVIINTAFAGGQTVTADMPRLGRSITWTGTTGAPVWSVASTNVMLFGSLTLATGITFTGANATTFAGRSAYTLASFGVTFTGALIVNAPAGTVTLQDAFLSSRSNTAALTLTNGTFADNGQTVTLGGSLCAFTMTGGTLNSSGTWSIPTTAAQSFWSVTGGTVNHTGTIVLSSTSVSTRIFAGGGKTYGNLTYTVAGSTGTLQVTGANTFSTINFSDITNARILQFTAGTTTTITSLFNVQGTAGKLMSVQSVTAATHTLSMAAGTENRDYLSLTNSIATGGAAWYAGANSVDNGGNTGWIFTAAPPAGPTVIAIGRSSSIASLGIGSIARL